MRCCCRKNTLNPTDGLSRRTLIAIVRIEETRNYVWAGDVGHSLRLWRDFVQEPDHRLWDPDRPGCTEWLCCGEPHQARDNLEWAMLAMPRAAARELRRIIDEFDERY
ncbi:hypothetical protein J7E96_06680 [Streptomyces sp. ISL-96]|nr:hypothetical protein [Streptomyces sp. ISL-96]